MNIDEELVMIPRGKLDLLTKVAESAFRLETVVKGYYEEHQSVGCNCVLCENAERALRRPLGGYNSAA
jgi:hypothetical protein